MHGVMAMAMEMGNGFEGYCTGQICIVAIMLPRCLREPRGSNYLIIVTYDKRSPCFPRNYHF